MTSRLSTIIISSLLLLIAGRFLLAGWHRLPRHANSTEGDHGAYLQLGLDVREQGILTDGKRPPLYPLILATFARREWAYFTWAKIINLGLSLVTIGSLFEIGRRLFGPATGLLAAFLLSLNMEFLIHSTFALAESLLVLMVLLSWFMMVRALQHPDQLRYWLGAGIFAGLAFLAKGTGPLIAGCFIIAATLYHSPRLWLKRSPWAFMITLVLVTSPLWIYNWLTFGSPVFNSAINNVMWMDDATEKYVADTAEMPTMTDFLQDNDVGQMWHRLTDGLSPMRYFFLKLMWPNRSLWVDDFYQSGQFDILLLSLLITGSVIAYLRPQLVREQAEPLLLTGLLVAVFYVLFAWYLAIAPYPIRFLLPLLPLLYLLLAVVIVGSWRLIVTGDTVPRWGQAIVVGGLLYLLYYPAGLFLYTTGLLLQADLPDPFATDAEFNSYKEGPLVWVRTGRPETAEPVTVMWGPTHQLPVWRHSDRLNLIRTPVAQVASAAELQTFMTANDVAYIIVEDEMLDRLGSLGPALGLTQLDDEWVQIGDVPTDWALGYVRPAILCESCVFRRLTANPPIQPADYRLGETIRLFGYELDDSRFRPGGDLVVILYWEALGPAKADYTIFNQLLGPDFQLHGQMDGPPLAGHWPTTRWQAGQKFMDKFIIPIDETAPTGEYSLLVGMYELQSGLRATATQAGQPLPDNAIPLARFVIPAPEATAQ